MNKAKFVTVVLMALLLLPARAAFAAEDLASVLAKLDTAAARFHTTTADFEFKNVQTQPLPDEDTQTGTVDYERKGSAFQMGVHIDKVNGKPVPKVYVYSGGVFKLYEKLINQVTTLNKLSEYESWFMLGFGASGRDLSAKWQIKYLGTEKIDGVDTAKLELIPKDPAVLKYIQKATLWMDTERGISLQQRFDEGPDGYRTCHYFNIKLNQPLPNDAFTLHTDKNTTTVTR
jgi:outer membrane lipoprotein-sorting protein